MLPAAGQVLAGIRGAKSTAKVSQRTEVTAATASGPAAVLDLAALALGDVKAAGRVVGELTLAPAAGTTDVTVEATLAE